MQLLERALLGILPHPRQLLNLALHGRFDSLGHSKRALLGGRRERLGDKFLAQRLADVSVHAPHAAFPARRHLLHSAQILAIEIEIRIVKSRRQGGSPGMHQMPAQISFPVVQLAGLEQRLHFLEISRLCDVDGGCVRRMAGLEVIRPVERWSQSLQLRRSHFMKQLIRIALIHARERSFCQRRLDLHHGLGVSLRRGRRLAEQFEHVLHVFHIFLPRLLGLRVGLGVVIAVGKAQTARVGKRDHAAGILHNPDSIRIQTACHRPRFQDAGAPGMRADRESSASLAIASSSGFSGADSGLLHRGLVHAGGEVVADLSFHHVPCRTWLGRFHQNPPQETLVVLVQLGINVPARLIRRDRILLDPSPARVVVKVGARIHRPVHGRCVQAGAVRQGEQRRIAGLTTKHTRAAGNED